MAPSKKRVPRIPARRPKENDPEVDEVTEQAVEEQTPKEFVQEMFGAEAIAEPQEGLPTRDWLKDNYRTKSAAIRYLISKGYTVNEISKHLGVKYQHVRNVAYNPLKRGPNEDWRPKAERQPTPLMINPIRSLQDTDTTKEKDKPK